MARFASTLAPGSKNVTAVRATARSTPPTPEQIRLRAYEIYLARGAEPGRDLDDWVQAENALRPKSTVATR